MGNTIRIISRQRPLDLLHDGKVTLVGFGPGDPDLLTIKGHKALQNADVIFFDDLTNEAFLVQFKAEKIYVGKRSGKHSHCQDEINELLYQSAIQGNNVVRLKGGDPMLFSHGREEVDFLRDRKIEVDIIPGISSGNALASLLQIPLTHRGVARSVAMVLGHSDELQTPNADTLLYYMGGSSISRIVNSLIESGRDESTSAAIVTNVSLPNQRAIYSSLKELRYAIFKDTPVLLMIGEVVEFESRLATFEFEDVSLSNSDGQPIDFSKVDKVIFSSSSAVDAFKNLYGSDIPKHLLLIAKDSATFEAVKTI